jgi:hypothetical protein
MIRFLVVIYRDGVPAVTGFEDLEEATRFFEAAAEQWSDSYLCEVMRGPKV